MIESKELVGDIAPGNISVLTVESNSSVAATSREMRDKGVSSLIVVSSEGRIVGIVTERDVVRKIVAEGFDPANVKVSAVMTTNVLGCSPQTNISKAAQVMADHRIRHLPIIRDGVPVGMISSRDIMAHELSASKSVIRRQSQFINELESAHPGIGDVERNASGRIVI